MLNGNLTKASKLGTVLEHFSTIKKYSFIKHFSICLLNARTLFVLMISHFCLNLPYFPLHGSVCTWKIMCNFLAVIADLSAHSRWNCLCHSTFSSLVFVFILLLYFNWRWNVFLCLMFPQLDKIRESSQYFLEEKTLENTCFLIYSKQM